MNTAPNILADKLDRIEKTDLGFSTDEALLWDKLQDRLENSKRRVPYYRWLMVACILLVVMMLPVSLLKEPVLTGPEKEVISQVEPIEDMVVKSIEQAESTRIQPKKMDVISIEKKAALLDLSLEEFVASVHLVPVEVPKAIIKEKPLFDNKDISVIQASLEKPKAEKEARITVRARLYTSSNDSETNYKKLKVNLNGKNN